MFEQYEAFLDHVFADIEKMGIDVSHFDLDHIAYTASTKDEYETLRAEILEMGKLVGEDLVGGRRVGVVRLNTDLKYKERNIPGIELIEPVQDKPTESRLDHIEFVTPMGFKNLMETYPNIPWDMSSMDRPEYPHLKVKGLQIKFHELSIFDTIEKQHGRRKEQQT